MTPVTFIFPADKSTDLTNSRDTAARELSEAALPAPETVSNDGALCKLLIFEQCRSALLLISAGRRCFSNEHLSFSLTELQTSHVPTGHEMVGQPVHSVCRGNGCLVFSRLLRTQSIYITYNTFHTRRASTPTTASPTTRCRFIGSQALTHSFTRVTEEWPLLRWCMATVYTNHEQWLCLFMAVEGIPSLDFRTKKSLLNNAFLREMSSQLENTVLSAPKMGWILNKHTKSMLFCIARVWCKPIPE